MSPHTKSSDDTSTYGEIVEQQHDPKYSGPPSLQFISVGPGGTISSAKTVRSHAIKAHHQNKRDLQKAHWERLSQQRHRRLRPTRAIVIEDAIDPSKDADEGLGTEDHGTASGGANEGRVTKLQSTLSLTTLSARPHRRELIPYAWFEKDGPVLYIDQSKWPFPNPFRVTASDRSDQSPVTLTPRQSHWMPYIRPPDVVSVKGAVLDPQVLLWIGQTPECFRFRVQTIRWIQDQLQDPLRMTSNATIGAIMTFTMWTAGYGNPAEISRHMDAIQKIVDIRGGFLSYEGDGAMMPKLTSFDSLVAVLTGEPLRFPRVEYCVARPLTYVANRRLFHFESPLHGTSDFEEIIEHHQNRDAIVVLLNDMRRLVKESDAERCLLLGGLDRAPAPPCYAVHFNEEARAAYTIPLLTLPLLSTCHEGQHEHVLETLQAAAVIFSRSLENPRIDFAASPANDTAFAQLGAAFAKCTPDDFWSRYPGILLWVLLVATAAARNRREAPFWIFYLSRVADFARAESWLAQSAAVRRFVDLQRWGREREREREGAAF
ncbi:hypothetical protein PVAG01_05991 [Phlyctema vagabunda]|uniref:Uncharacterized protein n=1 Tax=Phlyctema vagabunda TaxID=108571 RepID=A0ABR4PEZ3_9HELO